MRVNVAIKKCQTTNRLYFIYRLRTTAFKKHPLIYAKRQLNREKSLSLFCPSDLGRALPPRRKFPRTDTRRSRKIINPPRIDFPWSFDARRAHFNAKGWIIRDMERYTERKVSEFLNIFLTYLMCFYTSIGKWCLKIHSFVFSRV